MSQHHQDGDDEAVEVDAELAEELDTRAEAALSGDEFVSFEDHAEQRDD